MKHQSSLARASACLLLAMAGAHAHAQQALAAADPQAAVPATRYQPVLDKKPEAAPDASPEHNWVAGNETVAATNSMSLTMKAMGGHAGHGNGAQAQAPDPHAGHAGHDHASMPGMQMQSPGAPAMCTPAGAKGGEGMQCGDKSGGGKMSCCASCPCMDKMKKPKETS